MSSRLSAIAREDFRHVLRDRLLWGGFALTFLLTVPNFWQSARGRVRDTALKAMGSLPYLLRTYVVILAVVVAYGAVVSERESGTVRLLLGLPGTRRDVVAGKTASRVATLLLALAPLLGVFAVVIAVKYGSLPVVPYAVLTGWILLYGVTWTLFTVGVSAAFSSRYRVLVAVLATYGFFSPVVDIWGLVVEPAFALLFTGTLSVPQTSANLSGPLWYVYVQRLNPTFTFITADNWFLSFATPAESTLPSSPYLFGVLVLLLFGVVPLAVGHWRFERTDLE